MTTRCYLVQCVDQPTARGTDSTFSTWCTVRGHTASSSQKAGRHPPHSSWLCMEANCCQGCLQSCKGRLCITAGATTTGFWCLWRSGSSCPCSETLPRQYAAGTAVSENRFSKRVQHTTSRCHLRSHRKAFPGAPTIRCVEHQQPNRPPVWTVRLTVGRRGAAGRSTRTAVFLPRLQSCLLYTSPSPRDG